MAQDPCVTSSSLSGSRVLVTGATGFIGCRLAERLSVGGGTHVKALVHSWSGPGLARLGRLPVQIVRGDLLDAQSLRDAMSGCDVVVHCAFGNRGSVKQKTDITVEGTRKLLQTAVDAGVKRFIHLSTAVVHGRAPRGGVVDESSGFHSDGDLYSKTKIMAEKQVWQYHEAHRLPVVVFRPGIVYGPCGGWTSRVLNELAEGLYLINGGDGIANVIYLDNLIDALMIAIDNENAIGQSFLATDNETISWRRFYDAHADMVSGHPLPRPLPFKVWQSYRRKKRAREWAEAACFPLRIATTVAREVPRITARELRSEVNRRPWVRLLADQVPGVAMRGVKKCLGSVDQDPEGVCAANTKLHNTPQRYPDPIQAKLHLCGARYSNDKMKQVLGWDQRVSFEEAMGLIREWVAYRPLAA